MANIEFDVFTTESVQKLRLLLPSQPELIKDFDMDSVEKYELSLIESQYEISSETSALEMPTGIDQTSLKDSINCKNILNILPTLSAADATDERLWVTLGLLYFRDYSLARWPFSELSKKKIESHVRNHWFANGVRPRMRDNAISRLWWMGHIASKVPGRSVDEVFEVLFFNSDYRSSLLERNSSANAINVTSSILEITKQAYDEGHQYNRENFRDFMKEVDLVGGRTLLAALSSEQLTELLNPIYKKCYGIK